MAVMTAAPAAVPTLAGRWIEDWRPEDVGYAELTVAMSPDESGPERVEPGTLAAAGVSVDRAGLDGRGGRPMSAREINRRVFLARSGTVAAGTAAVATVPFNAVLADSARAQAVIADRNRAGVLSGIPLCIKDNYYAVGVRTTANSFIYSSFMPPYDATSVARLTAAGGIVIGKGPMGALATTRATTPNGTITTVNAWTPQDPSIDPGGSSTGPACSVAGRMATSSIGTQTGGSIVNPSNQQNLTA